MAKLKKLSIVIPCYNEKQTLREIVAEVLSVDTGRIKKELIIIDDASKDGTGAIADELARRHPEIKVLHQPKNQGKGAALKRGLLKSRGDVVIIQDADLEYDPNDYKRLLYPIERGNADVVYGSRFVGGEPHRVIYYSHTLANKFLTTLSNIFTGLNLTDMETGYKMLRGDLARKLAAKLRAKRFGFEPEITALVAKSGANVYEVGIGYYGRTKAEGKKIGFVDGLKAVGEIVKYNLLSGKK